MSGARPTDDYWGAPLRTGMFATAADAIAASDEWIREEFEKVRADMTSCRWRGREGGVPEHFVRENCGGWIDLRCGSKKRTWRCNMLSKTGCTTRYRELLEPCVDGMIRLELYVTPGHKHSTDEYCGAGVHPSVALSIDKLLMIPVVTPSKIISALRKWKVPDTLMPTERQVKNYANTARTQEMAERGMQGCLAGVHKVVMTRNYHTLKKATSDQGFVWSRTQAYIVPGPRLEEFSRGNLMVLMTTDAACIDLLRNIRHCQGGWIGVDGKHRTNYCGFPMLPIVSKDCANKYFVVAMAMLSDEKGFRVAACVRLLLTWLAHRFPLESEHLQRIDVPDSVDGDMSGLYQDKYDPATQEANPAPEKDSDGDYMPEDEEARAEKRCIWERAINGFVDWGYMMRGYPAVGAQHPGGGGGGDGRIGPLVHPVRVRYGGADNADNYASALAFSAHATVANCAVHLLVNNLCKPGGGLHKLLGGDTKARRHVVVNIKLIRSIPAVSPAGVISCEDLQRPVAATEIAFELMQDEMDAIASLAPAADTLHEEYWASERKRRWCGAFFPFMIPDHNAGTESRNKTIAQQLAGYTLCEVTQFLHKTLDFLGNWSFLRECEPQRRFSAVTTPAVTADMPCWRKVHQMLFRNGLAPAVANLHYSQMHVHKQRFLRHTSIRYTVPTRQLMQCALEKTGSDSYDAEAVQLFIDNFRARHSRLLQDPTRYVHERQPSLHHFLLLTARAFYVLERLDRADVRSIYVQYSCTCCAFRQKGGYCKHSIAQTVLDGLVRVPPELDLRTIGSLPKRGRKRKLFTTKTYLSKLTDTAPLTPISKGAEGSDEEDEGVKGLEDGGSDDEDASEDEDQYTEE